MLPYQKVIHQTAELYACLQDSQSQKIFWDRLACDVQPTVERVLDLYLDSIATEEKEKPLKSIRGNVADIFARVRSEGKQLILYGTGVCARKIVALLHNSGIDFDGFCDRRYEKMKDYEGKPVYPPEYLLANAKDCYVLIATIDYAREVIRFLLENQFPQDHILPYFRTDQLQAAKKQYFEFPQYYPHGTAFVDGGCFDGEDSLYFAQWCRGEYSKIFAFEPDSSNQKICKQTAREHQIAEFHLIPAGLSGKSGDAMILRGGSGATSRIIGEIEGGISDGRALEEEQQKEHTRVVALDDMVGDTTIGFIKLDIEGFEMSALKGAEKTLLRDKPFLAVCVYHKPGDVLEIMDYLHALIPEYRFWLRHYTVIQDDTVLYAAIL